MGNERKSIQPKELGMTRRDFLPRLVGGLGVVAFGGVPLLLVACQQNKEVTPAAVQTSERPVAANTPLTPTIPPATATLRPSRLPERTPTPYVSNLTKAQRNLGLELRQAVIYRVERDFGAPYIDKVNVDKFSHKLIADSSNIEAVEDAHAKIWLGNLEGNTIRDLLTMGSGDGYLEIKITLTYDNGSPGNSDATGVRYIGTLPLEQLARARVVNDGSKRVRITHPPDAAIELFNLPPKLKESIKIAYDEKHNAIGFKGNCEIDGEVYDLFISNLGELEYSINRKS